MKNNIAICLFTSTKGHFGIVTRYRETVKSINSQAPIHDFGYAIAHIKVSDGDEEMADEMQLFLELYGFEVYRTNAEWKHHDISHQQEYLNDMYTVFSTDKVLECDHALFMEDDMILVPRKNSLQYYMHSATKILRKEPEIISVRIPRVENEKFRIEDLRRKHSIDAVVKESGRPELYFYGSDFSNNPHFCRPRDMRNALLLIIKNPGVFMVHSEMGLGPALKYFTLNRRPASVAVFDPSQIVARHIGSEIGEEEAIETNYYYE